MSVTDERQKSISVHARAWCDVSVCTTPHCNPWVSWNIRGGFESSPNPSKPHTPSRRHFSEIRQVPDNQEAFVDQASEASLILELLELERDKDGPEVFG